MLALNWTKVLSLTDAQRPTAGRLVPYLRLTKGDLQEEDFQSWFRNVFFGNQIWVPCKFGKNANAECAYAIFDINIGKNIINNKELRVTHSHNRRMSHSAPNTWLHWSDEISDLLRSEDFSGKNVLLKRNENGNFRLKI